MIVKETKNAEEIKKVLCHPAIWGRIGGDVMSEDDFNPPMDCQYVAGYVDDVIIAVMIYNEIEERLKCHIQVLPEYRKEYAREFARMALKFGEAKNASIYAEIPDCYPEVISFAEEFDFKIIGREKNGSIRNGVPHDKIILRRENGIH